MLQSNNGSMDVFPRNTVSDFRNKLPSVLKLDPRLQWQCGLAELSYTFGNSFVVQGELIATIENDRTGVMKPVNCPTNVRTIQELFAAFKMTESGSCCHSRR